MPPSRSNVILSTPFHPVYLRSTSQLSSRLCLDLSSISFNYFTHSLLQLLHSIASTDTADTVQRKSQVHALVSHFRNGPNDIAIKKGARNLFFLDQSLSFSPSVAHKGSVACWTLSHHPVQEPPKHCILLLQYQSRDNITEQTKCSKKML